MLLFLLLAGTTFFRKIQGSNIVEASLLYRLLRRLFTGVLHKLMASVQKKASQKISADTRLKWSASAGSIRQLRQRYGLLFLRPFFLVVQLFGVSFNTGVLAATLFKVIGADLAFGWQSTLQVTPSSVYDLVHWISLPWSWLPDPFTPTLSQIEGSRLVLKDGIYHLINADLTSWWPFLCLSVFCYGLLPRLALLLFGTLRQRLDLVRLDFQQGCLRQPLHRMRTPQVSTAAYSEPWPSSPGARLISGSVAADARPKTDDYDHGPVQEIQQEQVAEREADTLMSTPITALIPDELLEDCPYTALQEQVRRRFGYKLCQLFPFWTLTQSEEEELVALKTAMEQEKSTDILILLEAPQPQT
ncbi:MAG: DUF2868 domain-containing protein, partial [Candidatus Electrothrix sp. ATG2]|nr:DUF2868 domain-containing protein [Candidatus Electrothrix sp. ATG2]